MAITAKDVIRSPYERALHEHWTDKTDDPINLLLGQDDGLYHHHYAVGDFDRSILDADPAGREQRILAEMHRMETEQVDLILDGLTGLTAQVSVVDAGSGRGGTSFMIHDRYGCRVDGVNFCRHHLDFAENLSKQRGCDQHVRFHYANMVDTGLPEGTYDAVVTNETTMYVDLVEAFTEFARLLTPGGRYVGVTWCWDDLTGPRSPAIDAIDEHYVCNINARSAYILAMLEAGLIPTQIQDLTQDAIPYWELRSASQHRTGVEPHFLNGYRTGALRYVAFTAYRRRHSED